MIKKIILAVVVVLSINNVDAHGFHGGGGAHGLGGGRGGSFAGRGGGSGRSFASGRHGGSYRDGGRTGRYYRGGRGGLYGAEAGLVGAGIVAGAALANDGYNDGYDNQVYVEQPVEEVVVKRNGYRRY